MNPEDAPAPAASPFKSRSGLARILAAAGYSRDGFIAAFRHEAAFRQELAVGVPLIAISWWLAPTRTGALAMSAAIVFVFVVELLNSAVEALADTVTTEPHPLIKRAKDLGSAAVMLSITAAALVWVVVLSER